MARDLGDNGPEAQRRFDYVLTYDRDLVVAAAQHLMARVQPVPSEADQLPRPEQRLLDTLPVKGAPAQTLAADWPAGLAPELLLRALESTRTGLVIADARHADMPLVYVNPAFEDITGYGAEEVVGQNCRFLQGPGSDTRVVAEVGQRLREGLPAQATLLNYRKDGSTWHNELVLNPVVDASGQVTHYVGVQADVTPPPWPQPGRSSGWRTWTRSPGCSTAPAAGSRGAGRVGGAPAGPALLRPRRLQEGQRLLRPRGRGRGPHRRGRAAAVSRPAWRPTRSSRW